MRIAIITAQTERGEWVTLAHPDVPLNEQKIFFKQLKQENGRGVLIGNERANLVEAHLFISGSGKRIRFKDQAARSVGTAESDFVTKLDDLAEALDIPREKLDELRKLAGFPLKEKEGYNVEACLEFAEKNVQIPLGTDEENKPDEGDKE